MRTVSQHLRHQELTLPAFTSIRAEKEMKTSVAHGWVSLQEQGWRKHRNWMQNHSIVPITKLGPSTAPGFGGTHPSRVDLSNTTLELVDLCNQWFLDGMSISSQVLGLECWQFKMDYSGAHPGSYRGEYWLIAGGGRKCLWLVQAQWEELSRAALL